MAGEKFIALEETSQEIKASVETVNTSVNEIKVDVGDGAGTDLVSRVAQLQAKVYQLLSKGSGEIKILKVYGGNNAEAKLILPKGTRKKFIFVPSHISTNGCAVEGISAKPININGTDVPVSSAMYGTPLPLMIKIEIYANESIELKRTNTYILEVE